MRLNCLILKYQYYIDISYSIPFLIFYSSATNNKQLTMSDIDIKKLYEYYIYKRYSELKASGKEIDNFDLCKIFEWYTCLKLSEERGVDFYEYNDIDATFKEDNHMSRNDTGIDACNLIDTVVQCKLRKERLSFQECATFFASQVMHDHELQKPKIRWDNMIIARNDDCKLSRVLEQKLAFKLFEDRAFVCGEMIEYCERLLANPPQINHNVQVDFKLRDYQLEAIEIIKSNENSVVCLPTGCGKNIVIIYSLEDDKRYLILVPRIILMDQLYDEIIKHKPQYRDDIECVGDGNNSIDTNKRIYICVYNSIGLLENQLSRFDKIYIDEAHHIYKPMIYQEMEDEEILEDEVEESSNQVVETTNDLEESDEEDDISDTDSEASTEDEIESIITDDDQDELKPSEYMKIMRDLTKYKNNVYLSATIDEIDGFAFYKKDIREMIEKRYLCDYNIHIPIFGDDPSNKNICEHLVNNYRNGIIYCNSQREGQLINKLMNEIQPGSCEYIDCNTGRTKRKQILDRYKNDKIPFLVNVRILVEGFDAPITKSVIFLHLPSSHTTLVQIIGRALRLHSSKTIANIVLPFSKIEDEKNITNFMRVMAKNDRRIMRSYVSKKLGGYIDIEDFSHDYIDRDVGLKYTMMYNSLGQILNGEEAWYYKLNQLKKFIDTYKRLPLFTDKNIHAKFLRSWLTNQMTYYKDRMYMMKNQKIYDDWCLFINQEYREYFRSRVELWYISLNLVRSFILQYDKKPSMVSRCEHEKRLGIWWSSQAISYKKNLGIMKDPEIRSVWEEFVNIECQKYCKSPEELWYNNFNLMKLYIDEMRKRPSYKDKEQQMKKLASWVQMQIHNYKNKRHIMKTQEIYDAWTALISDAKYQQYFLSQEESWYHEFNLLKSFILKYNKRPSKHSKHEPTKRIGRWLDAQLQKYKNKTQIMKKQEFRDVWQAFISSNEFKQYFQ